MDLVSVIVPVFKTENYLDECIDSITRQDYDNLEIILVDDGSPDMCPIMCDEWAKKDKRIVSLHKSNGGLSSARNFGVASSNGKYVVFCDSDDKMKSNMISMMYKRITDDLADLAICGIERFPDGKKVIPFWGDKCLSGEKMINSCHNIHSQNEFCFAVRFMFKRAFLESISLSFDEEVRIGEDFLYCTEAIARATRVSCISSCLYLYRNTPNSMMNVKFKEDLNENYQLQYEKKIALTKRLGLEENKTWMQDLQYYYVSRFQGILFANALNAPTDEQFLHIKNALNLPMLQDNYKLRAIFKDGWKFGILCVCCKFKAAFLVYRFLKRGVKS